MALAVVAAAAIPSGWIALRHVPAQGEESGYWILVKEPADGLAAWWSDEELAKIIAGGEDYVQHLETDWNPDEHPVATTAEATALAEELSRYWDGDLPQANYWAHGALTRRGDTPQAFRWAEVGLTQRTELEESGFRPKTAVSPIDPVSIDIRWDNALDIVESGDGWGSHLLTPTLDHINRAERLRLETEHYPNSPTPRQINRATKATVSDCRSAGLEAEKSIFENYVRAWGGLDALDVTYDLPENCVLAIAPPTTATPPATVTPPPQPPVTPPTPPQRPITPLQSPQPPVARPQPPVTPPTPPQRPVTPPSNPNPGCTISWLCGSDPDPGPVDPDPDPDPVTTNPGNPGGSNPGNGGGTNPGGGGGGGGSIPPPVDYEACDGSTHSTQAAADAIDCTPPTIEFYDCNGGQHDTQAAADAVSCATSYTACDGSTHNTQDEADAVDCSQQFQEQILHDLTCHGTVDQTTGQCDDLTYTP